MAFVGIRAFVSLLLTGMGVKDSCVSLQWNMWALMSKSLYWWWTSLGFVCVLNLPSLGVFSGGNVAFHKRWEKEYSKIKLSPWPSQWKSDTRMTQLLPSLGECFYEDFFPSHLPYIIFFLFPVLPACLVSGWLAGIPNQDPIRIQLSISASVLWLHSPHPSANPTRLTSESFPPGDPAFLQTAYASFPAILKLKFSPLDCVQP